MVGFTQFHHLVVVGGGGGMELLGTGRGAIPGRNQASARIILGKREGSRFFSAPDGIDVVSIRDSGTQNGSAREEGGERRWQRP